MKNSILINRSHQGFVCSWRSTQAAWLQLGLVAAAVLLPAAAHLTGAPVRWLLPMHWPIILAGLVYGWRSGLVVGLLAPVSNWLLTGYPLPMVLPAMTVELALYGFIAGWLRECADWNRFAAVGLALIVGRVFFLGTVLFANGFIGYFGDYVVVAMLPGVVAGGMQVILLPLIARLFILK